MLIRHIDGVKSKTFIFPVIQICRGITVNAFYRTVSVCLILAIPVPCITNLLNLSAVSLDLVSVVVKHSLCGCTGNRIVCDIRLVILQTFYFSCDIISESGKFLFHCKISISRNFLGIFYHAV